MSGPVIAIVGGGVYVPRLCALVSQALPRGGAMRLFARRPERLARIADYSQARLVRGWRVTAAPTLAECVDGADAVVVLVRVGGLEARAHDERFAEAFGLVGDEGLGPGGFANAYRTLPVLAELAETMRAHCPRALVCNLVAPLGLTTRALLDEGLDAIGVCELPVVTLDRLLVPRHSDFDRSAPVLDVHGFVAPPRNTASIPSSSRLALNAESSADTNQNHCGEVLRGQRDGVTFAYAGLNHLGWFWELRRHGEALLPAAVAGGLVDGEVLDRFGAAPLRYYYEVFDRAAGARLGITRRPGRAHALMDLSERALAAFAAPATDAAAPEVAPLDERPTPWFDRALVPLLAARFGGAPYVGFVNVANELRIPSLPPATVVELPARVSGASCVVAPAPACPPRVAAFLRAVAEAEDYAYRAARTADPALLARAMEALPLGLTRAQSAALAVAALADTVPADDAPAPPRTLEATP